MDAKTARHILEELCTRFGLCLGWEKTERLVNDRAETVEEFADQVIRAEGLDPISNKALRKQACEVIKRRVRIPN